ncbi:MAG: MMPL family transporter [Planctomycetales bacterium]|nr:MMPL family transporter [Planctomycetales bacterium]
MDSHTALNRPFFERYARWIVALVVLLVPGVIYGVQGAMRGSNNDIRQWLPSGFEETKQYDWFLEHFGSEEIAVMSWPGATLDDPRIQQVAAGLRRWTESTADLTSDTATTLPLFRRVLTGADAQRVLTSEPLNLPRAEALRRLQGTLVGPDGKTSGLVVMVGEAGAADRHRAVAVLQEVAEEAAGLSAAELRMGGPTIDSVALYSESQRMRYTLSAGSVLLALFLGWRCLKQVKLAAIVFATSLFCAALSVSIVYYTGGTMSLVLVTMPTMIFVLVISGAIHLVHYYRDATVHRSMAAAPNYMVAAGWLPTTLTGCTTAVGLASLAVSEVVPVKQFGIYSATGVLIALPVLFLFLPSALTLWPVRPRPQQHEEESDARKWKLMAHHDQGWTGWLSHFVERRHAWIASLGLLIMTVAAVGLFRLETTVKLLSMFSPESRILQDYAWLEEHLGPLVPVEVVLEFDDQNEMSILQRLALVNQVQQTLDNMNMVGGTMSAATFTPDLPRGRGIGQIIQKSVIQRRLAAAMSDEAGDPYVRSTDDGQLWRISARVEALNSLDYGQFTEALRKQVEPLLRKASDSPGDIRATYTGVVPLIYKAQRALLNDLTSSFLTAFLLIGIVMMFALRGVAPGIVSMLPNVFPAIVIFGSMGWIGRLCDIGSMMTASVALGIAVDDTVHYLSWFRRGMRQGLSRREAIQYAYENCARAMLQTTIICGFGMLVFALSAFVPTSRFASMIFMMLVTALIGDLLFLPALLAGPLGRFFETEGRLSRWWTAWQLRRSQPAISRGVS